MPNPIGDAVQSAQPLNGQWLEAWAWAWVTIGRVERRRYHAGMCRNITELRGLEPPATSEEVDAAALQFVRKVTGVSKPNVNVAALMQQAAHDIAAITAELLAQLPDRRNPPKSVPPLRRPEVRKRLGLEPFTS